MNDATRSVGLAIFVKTPGHSPVKTRLATGTDARFSEAFHLRAAQAVAEVAGQCAGGTGAGPLRLRAYWAVAEPAAADPTHWPDLPCLPQPAGTLGTRMAGIHDALMQRHDAAILVGADSPQMQSRWLQQAAQWLAAEGPRCVLGPARDGGFWLFGSNRRLPTERWEDVAYSRPDTADCFRAAFATAGAWTDLPELVDVDTVEDLEALRLALRALPTPVPAQSALLGWLDAQPEHAAPGRPRTRSDA